jgi:hypothetical protein
MPKKKMFFCNNPLGPKQEKRLQYVFIADTKRVPAVFLPWVTNM